MDMQKQIKEVMAKTQIELDANKAKVTRLIEYANMPEIKDKADKYRAYVDIGVTVCRIKKLDNMVLEQQFHADKVCIIDFITFPAVFCLKLMNKIFKK